ncbi:unnamed protein product [Gadus morhua 'NCC']
MIASNASLSGCAGSDGAGGALCVSWRTRGRTGPASLRPGNRVVAVCLGVTGTLGLPHQPPGARAVLPLQAARSPINMLLVNIALSDLLVCLPRDAPSAFAAARRAAWADRRGRLRVVAYA